MAVGHIQKSLLRLSLPLLAALVMVSGFAPAASASVSGWQAGNIIDDAVMANYSSLSVSEISSFLKSKVDCDTYGRQTSELGGGTRAQYGASRGNPTPFVCLENYYESTSSTYTAKHKYRNKSGSYVTKSYRYNANNYYKITGFTTSYVGGSYKKGIASVKPIFTNVKLAKPSGAKSAAQLIADAAHEYRISPKTILVLLEKEQSLVRDEWPLAVQFYSAAGYGCPDTAPCDPDYANFRNQIRAAARMFRAILNNSSSWYTPYELGWNSIQYNPNASCGDKDVYIKNRATQALYNYTPYQPNTYALNGGTSSAYPQCGAFGNLNFYKLHRSWFGSTRSDVAYKPLETPRWMQLAQNTYKLNLATGTRTSQYIKAGTRLYFPDKTTRSDVVYLRSDYDQSHNKNYGIALSSLIEVPYTPIATPVYYVMRSTGGRVVPATGKTVSGSYAKGSYQRFGSSMTLGGRVYYRTVSDTTNNVNAAIPATSLKPIPFESMDDPRWMQLKQSTTKKTIPNLSSSGSALPSGQQLYFTSKISYQGKLYLRVQSDTTAKANLVIPYDALKAIPYIANSTSDTGWKTLTSTVYKVDPYSGKRTAAKIEKGQSFYTRQHVVVNGVTYYRTAYDTAHGIETAAIAASSTRTPQFAPLDTPRKLTLRHSAAVEDLASANLRDVKVVPRGARPTITTKLLLDGRWYLRSSQQTASNAQVGIRADAFGL